MKTILIFLSLAILFFGCQKAREARELKKQHQAEAVPMSGMLRYMADAASLVDCATNEQYVVKFKGDWLEVERAYVSMRLNGAPTYVEFRGRMENDTTDGRVHAGVVIEEILNMRPDTSCLKKPEEAVPDTTTAVPAPVAERPALLTDSAMQVKPQKRAEPTLINKRWKLVQMNGESITVTDEFRSEPYITLAARSDKMTGSGGCNRFGCKYTIEGEKVSFSGFASTKMMCPEAMKIEEPFLRELAVVNGYKFEGDNGMWLTRDGKRVMKFEAVNPR